MGRVVYQVECFFIKKFIAIFFQYYDVIQRENTTTQHWQSTSSSEGHKYIQVSQHYIVHQFHWSCMPINIKIFKEFFKAILLVRYLLLEPSASSFHSITILKGSQKNSIAHSSCRSYVTDCPSRSFLFNSRTERCWGLFASLCSNGFHSE